MTKILIGMGVGILIGMGVVLLWLAWYLRDAFRM